MGDGDMDDARGVHDAAGIVQMVAVKQIRRCLVKVPFCEGPTDD